MTAGDSPVPQPIEATDRAGVPVIESVVARRRSEVTRLSLSARTARQRCERAEAALDAQPTAGGDTVPSDLLAVVDTMLEGAVRASELGLEAARGDAAYIVSSAVSQSAESLRRLGIDPSVLPAVRRPADSTHQITPPPSAADLWRSSRRGAPAPSAPSAPVASPSPAPSAPVGSTVVARPPAGPPSTPPSMVHPTTTPIPASAPSIPVVAEPAMSVAPAPAVAERPAPAPAPAPAVGTLVLDTPIAEPGQDGSAEVFDIFWQEVPGERRVRDRLLRRSPKEGA